MASTFETTAARLGTTLDERTTRHIGKVIVHPTSPDVAYVAALGTRTAGTPSAASSARVMAAKPWEKVSTSATARAAATSFSDPQNPTSSSPQCGRATVRPGLSTVAATGRLYRSNDDGTTWSASKARHARGSARCIGVAVSRSPESNVTAVAGGGDTDGRIVLLRAIDAVREIVSAVTW